MGVINLNRQVDELKAAVATAQGAAEDAADAAEAVAVAQAKTFISDNTTAITDMNELLSPGIYSKLTGITNVSNRASNNAFIVEVIQMGADAYYTIQRWTDVTTAAVYVRVYRKSNTTWTDWKEQAVVTPATT